MEFRKALTGLALIAALNGCGSEGRTKTEERVENFLACNYWEDLNKDNKVDENELFHIKDTFKRDEKITVMARLKGYKDEKITVEAYSSAELIGKKEFDVCSNDWYIGVSEQILPNTLPSGDYTLVWKHKDKILGKKQIKVE